MNKHARGTHVLGLSALRSSGIRLCATTSNGSLEFEALVSFVCSIIGLLSTLSLRSCAKVNSATDSGSKALHVLVLPASV